MHGFGNAGSYLAARYARDKGDVDAASYYYSHSLGHSPYDENLMKQAVRTHVLAGRVEDAARVAENLDTLYEGTQLSHLVLLVNNLRTGSPEKAAQHLQKTDPYGLFSVIHPILQAWISLAQTGKPSEIAVSEHLKKLQVFDGLLVQQNALIFDAGGDAARARGYYEQIAQNLQGVSYRSFQAMVDFYRRQGDQDTARKLVERYIAENTSNSMIDGLTVDTALMDAASAPGKPFVATPADGVAEALFSLAGMLYGENVTAETQLYLQLSLYLKPDMPDALLMLGSILEDRGSAEKAITFFGRIPPSSGPAYRRAQVRKAFLLAGMEKTKEALALLDDMKRKYPKSPDIWVSEGDVYRKLSRFDDAIDSYSMALAMEGGTLQEHHWPVLFARGISYERNGDWEKAEADFQQALALYPDQPDVLNYLGYSWLTKGTNLAKAREMLEQAVAERPEDGHIIDSMGWALYLLGDYHGALEYLEQAVNLMPNDPVVNDHYGDALWRVGRRNEARFQWDRALYFGPEEKEREQIEAKLKSGLVEAAAPAPSVNAAQR